MSSQETEVSPQHVKRLCEKLDSKLFGCDGHWLVANHFTDKGCQTKSTKWVFQIKRQSHENNIKQREEVEMSVKEPLCDTSDMSSI